MDASAKAKEKALKGGCMQGQNTKLKGKVSQPGKDPEEDHSGSMRPISLISVCCKLLEQILNHPFLII